MKQSTILIVLFFILIITMYLENKKYERKISYKKEIVTKNISYVKNVGIYYNIFKKNISKIDTTVSKK